MVKPEWGSKQTCPRCNTRFYDLGKADPVTCINCGNAWVPEPILKSKQPLPFEDTAAKAKARPDGEDVELIEADDLLADDDIDGDDDSSGDVSLDDDDADLSEVVDPGMEEE